MGNSISQRVLTPQFPTCRRCRPLFFRATAQAPCLGTLYAQFAAVKCTGISPPRLLPCSNPARTPKVVTFLQIRRAFPGTLYTFRPLCHDARSPYLTRVYRSPSMSVSPAPGTTLSTVSIDALVQGLRGLPAGAFDTVEAPLAFLQAHPVDAATLAPYLFWDAQHYTRNLIDKTDLYELMAICWEVGMKSSIHNHKDQNCWMAAAMGRLAVHNYRVLEEDLTAQHCDIVETDVVEISPAHPVAVDPLNPVHDVRNLREYGERAVSLHLYSRPFDSCVVYSIEQHSCGEIGLRYTSMYGKRG